MAKMLKRVTLGKDARASLQEGMRVVYEAVSSTLGPRSRNVAIDIAPDQDVPPTILRDGVSVARAVNLVDPNEDMGARLLKSAANKTVSDVGDGTTLTTILAYNIVAEAMKNITAGANPMQLKQEIEESAKLVVAKLVEYAAELKTDKEKESIATISASDPIIGKLVFEALNTVGQDGVITVEEGKSLETIIEYKQGMELDRGYLSPYFVTDQERVEGVVENPYILITDKKLNYHTQILPLFELVAKEGKSKDIVIIAGEIVEEALGTLIVNNLQNKVNVVGIQAPAFGGRRIDELEDIAVLTGGTVIMADSGREIDTVKLEELGRCEKFVADRDKSIIINGAGSEAAVQRKIEELRQQIKIANTTYDEEIKQERLAKLLGGVAVINVGGATEIEVREKKERVIDALAATRAAIEEGIVAGGEISLYYLASEGFKTPSKRFSLGRDILLASLKAPFKKLLSNSGLDYAETLQKLSGYPQGVDVIDGQVKDLIKAGVIDPVKVLRTSIENAVSVACLALTTDSLITWEVPDE